MCISACCTAFLLADFIFMTEDKFMVMITFPQTDLELSLF